MAKRIFLHVGTPKTGTTYIQSVIWSNKNKLAEQGLFLPLARVRDHFFLSNIGRDASTEISDMPPRAMTSWDRMMDQVGRWGDDALISHELFAMTFPDRAEWIIDQLRSVADEVHPIITARDLARQVPAEWQQSIKHGRTHTLREFYHLIRAEDPSVMFWRAQDLPRQVSMWSQGLAPENVHLITVPPLGGPREALWQRFASVVGVDPDSVDLSFRRPNESLGRVEIETLRRVNTFAPMGATKPLRQMMVRVVLAEGILAPRPDAERFAAPVEEHAWVVETGDAMVAQLREMAFDVVGDLDDLLPAREPAEGPVPDDASDTDVAGVAVEAISSTLYRTHERETSGYQDEIARLKGVVEARDKRITHLETRLRDAWATYEQERSRPIWRQAARKAREVGGHVASRVRPGSADHQP